jgi:hypothetical protein
MITLAFLITTFFTLVSPQLVLVQHTALMALYDALGSKRQRREKNLFLLMMKNLFLLEIFQAAPLLHAPALRPIRRARAVDWRVQEAT